MKKFPVAVQPYTFRDAMAADYEGSLTKLAQIGYKGVELGPPPEGITIIEQKSLLQRLGLQVVGCHAALGEHGVDVERYADYLEEMGGEKYVAISMFLESKEDLLNKIKLLNETGEKFSKRGITFLYHNHHWEFAKFDGEYMLDILLRETDPNFVQMELDTYWAYRGGEDPADYLAKLNNRAPLLHIKDMGEGGKRAFEYVRDGKVIFEDIMAAHEEEPFAEIGEGVLDFTRIASVAEEVGTQWLIVEQDHCRRDPFESLQISYNHLQKLGIME